MRETGTNALKYIKLYEESWGELMTQQYQFARGLYSNQSRMVEAEAIFLQALTGMKKAWGPNHTSTQSMVNDLGSLYSYESKMVETPCTS